MIPSIHWYGAEEEGTPKRDAEIKKPTLTRVNGQRWEPKEVSGHKQQKKGRYIPWRRTPK